MDKILFDTNIILDWLLERKDFYESSTRCIEFCKNSLIQGFLTPHSISDIFYIMRKEKGLTESKEFMTLLVNLFYVLAEDENTLNSIVDSDLWKNNLWNDVEDAMQMVSASLNNMDLILTRNPKDFKNSAVIYLSPDEYLAKNSCANGLDDISLHPEIDLSDPRKSTPDKPKTVTRHPIKKDK